MKRRQSRFLLLAGTLLSLLLLVGCPAVNGNAPFDVLAGRTTLAQLAADAGAIKGLTVTQVTTLSSTQTRGTAATFYVSVRNDTSDAITVRYGDTAQLYCAKTNAIGSMYSNVTGVSSLYGSSISLGSTSVYVGAGSTGSLTLSVVPNTAAPSFTGPCRIGVKLTIGGNATVIPATDGNAANMPLVTVQ